MKTDKKTIIIPDFLIFLKQLTKQPDQSVTNVQLETTITYSHLHNMKKVLCEKGLITIGKENVKNVLNLTPKGKQVVDKAIELFGLLDITEDNILEFRRRGKIKYRNVNQEETEKEITLKDINNINEVDVNGGEDETTYE